MASQFANAVSDVIGIATDWDIRRGAVDALYLLWQQEDVVDTRHLVTAVNLVLNSTRPPSPKVSFSLILISAGRITKQNANCRIGIISSIGIRN